MSSTTYCDHCGKPCAGFGAEKRRCTLNLPVGNFQADLCSPCLDELLAFIGRRERYAAPVRAAGEGDTAQ